MAAGLSREREYRIVYAKLQEIKRELEAAGIRVEYANRVLTGDGFTIYYRRLNASNGETALLPVMYLGGKCFDHLDFERGLDQLKATQYKEAA